VIEFGTIALARLPFTDPSGDKSRPVLIVSRDNDRRADVVVCFITSVPRAAPDMAMIEASSDTGPKVRSTVRFDKLASLDKSVIAGRLGAAPADWLVAQRETFFGVFGFGT
jgi:mRNA interferase MazF